MRIDCVISVGRSFRIGLRHWDGFGNPSYVDFSVNYMPQLITTIAELRETLAGCGAPASESDSCRQWGRCTKGT